MGEETSQKAYPVIFLVNEDTPQLARETVVSLCVAMVVATDEPFSNFSLSYIAPVRADTEDGQNLVARQWMAYATEILDDLGTVCRTLVPLLERAEPPVELLENLNFRAACWRIGLVAGWPVRVYDETGLGVVSKDHLHRLCHEENPWVIEVEIK